MEDIKLTQYSHGAGCGCKISPKVLDEIIADRASDSVDPNLLVDHHSKDDAAVFALDDKTAIISTTDFFMPIVDDPYDFGAIASTNAISDIYAMGGQPLIAISILGWPIDKLPASIAREVIAGARNACKKASIALAGGHSIDAPEPIFGLAVTGKAKKANIKTNDKAKIGSLLYLTKPLGIGILTTAQKRGILKSSDLTTAKKLMLTLNSIGQELGKSTSVTALTDVTGFGLLGHLIEICEGSGVSANLRFADVPVIDSVELYIKEKCIPGGTLRNFESYGKKVGGLSEHQKNVLCDPQTSGGLLAAVDPRHCHDVEEVFEMHGLKLKPFGEIISKEDRTVNIL